LSCCEQEGRVIRHGLPPIVVKEAAG
jgi:hypothetical protein